MASQNLVIYMIFILFSMSKVYAVIITNHHGSYFTMLPGHKITTSPFQTEENPVKRKSYCTQRCLSTTSCKTFSVNSDKTLCILSKKSVIQGEHSHSPDASWDTYSKNEDGWHLVLKATMGNNAAISSYWAGSTYYDTTPGINVIDVMHDCGCHYKHKMVENWNELNPKEIKISILNTPSTEVGNLVFDGAGTDKLTWFSSEKLNVSKSSTDWQDLESSTKNWVLYSPGEPRSFYLWNAQDNCNGDKGWFVIIDSATASSCSWDQYYASSTWPKLFYSGSNGKIAWETESVNVKKADRFAIYVRL